MRFGPLFSCLAAAATALAAGVAQAQGDPQQGQRAFNKCRTCHEVEREQNKIGPHLVGIFGREAGAVEGFNYSPALKESGIVWDDETIGEYVQNPRDFIPGNRMAFAGIRNEQEIQDLLAYLRQATGES